MTGAARDPAARPLSNKVDPLSKEVDKLNVRSCSLSYMPNQLMPTDDCHLSVSRSLKAALETSQQLAHVHCAEISLPTFEQSMLA